MWEELIACAMCAEPCIHPYLYVTLSPHHRHWFILFCRIQECKHTFCLRCLQKWFAECLHKDLQHVNLPDHLAAQRNLPTPLKCWRSSTTQGWSMVDYHIPVPCAMLKYGINRRRIKPWHMWSQHLQLHSVPLWMSLLTMMLGAMSAMFGLGYLLSTTPSEGHKNEIGVNENTTAQHLLLGSLLPVVISLFGNSELDALALR